MAAVKIIYYLDVLSSWCTFAEDALEKVRAKFGLDLDCEWRLAVLRESKPLGYSNEDLAWYYARSKSMTGIQLNDVWLESRSDNTWYPNLVAEAARSLGAVDDKVRLALAKAGMIDGQHVQHRDVAERIAAAASSLDLARLHKAVDDPAVAERIRATTAEYRALPVTVVPTFLISNEIGDVNLLSGAFRYEHIAECVKHLLADAKAYAAFNAANPAPDTVKK
jgi:predicted DsbA family dithiol-disulfide isomerase